MKIDKVYCLFEQSGTFKNQFKELGIDAEDYDVLDDYGETDHVIDLFAEIEKAYNGDASLFDNIQENDFVMAFFPCTRFETQITMAFKGHQYQQRNQTDLQKLEYVMKLHEELHELYILVCKLFAICERKGIRMVVENPYTQPHYLTCYFPIKPKVIDMDRTENGDYFKKPTQYWFVNCEPEFNMFFEPLEWIETGNIEKIYNYKIDGSSKAKRSLMHPQYARRFIKQYILDQEVVQC